MQGKLKNDEDFGIDGRIQVILLKRNSNDFTTTLSFYTAHRVLSVVCDVLSVLKPQVDIWLHRVRASRERPSSDSSACGKRLYYAAAVLLLAVC